MLCRASVFPTRRPPVRLFGSDSPKAVIHLFLEAELDIIPSSFATEIFPSVTTSRHYTFREASLRFLQHHSSEASLATKAFPATIKLDTNRARHHDCDNFNNTTHTKADQYSHTIEQAPQTSAGIGHHFNFFLVAVPNCSLSTQLGPPCQFIQPDIPTTTFNNIRTSV